VEDSHDYKNHEREISLKNCYSAAIAFRGPPTAFPIPRGKEEERGSSYLLLTRQPPSGSRLAPKRIESSHH
jgi:hypothetical protein